MNRKHQPRLALLATLAVCLVLVAAPSYAQTQPVTLTWDASHEPSVSGYIVYVGSASGSYDERYDVGSLTSFVYTRASAGVPYFFAISAYAPGRGEGPRSDEIFFLGGATARSSMPAHTAIAAGSAAPAHAELGHCTNTADPGCSSVDSLATIAGEVRALTPTGDGRLLFVEDGTRVRVLAGDVLVPRPALTAEPGSKLTGLVLDPFFERTRLVYVTEVDEGIAGSRLNIVRYREIANLLGERATIVTGIPLPRDGDAPLAIDGAGRLYLAVPDTVDGTRSIYGGMVLRFEADGSVSRDSRGGSPVLAHGYARPASLAWNGVRNELWLAGSDAGQNGALARLPLDSTTTEWPRVPFATSIVDTDSSIVSLYAGPRSVRGSQAADERNPGQLLAVDDAGGMLMIDARNLTLAAGDWLPAGFNGTPASAALDADYLYVVLTSSGGNASWIVRLQRTEP